MKMIPKHKNVKNTRKLHTESDYTEKDWHEEISRTIELQLLKIRNAVQKQTYSIHKKEIELTPNFLLFDDEILASIYIEDQLIIINKYLQTYNDYLLRFWYTKEGTLKTVFSGSINNPNTEVGQLVAVSNEICSQMDQWLTELLKAS